MTDIGLMYYYLGIQVIQMKKGIFFFQERYTKKLLKKFNMLDCKLVNAPMDVGAKLSKIMEDEDEEKVDSTMFKSLVRSSRYLTCT